MRIRRSSADSGDYDSVLDTMTNVVGILIIVVAITQLNVSSAVGRARAAMVEAGEAIDHPPVSDLALDGARRERDAARKRLDELKQKAGRAGSAENVSDAEWNDLKKRLREATPLESPGKLRREVTRLQRRLADLEAEIKRLEEQQRRTLRRTQQLEQQVEALKGRKVTRPPPMQMRLPDPDIGRAKGLDPVLFVVKGGKVYWLDFAGAFEEWLQDEARERAPPWLNDRARLERLADTWNKKRYQNEVLRLRFEVVPDRTVVGGFDIQIIQELRRDAKGTPLAELQSSGSAFRRTMKRLRPQKNWAFFRVYDDSFEAYIAARAIVDEGGFAAGWQPLGEGQIMASRYLRRGGRPITPN